MLPRRPSADVIAARKWEIKRRYARKGIVGRRTRSMAAIRLAELTRWLEHVHGRGELEPSDQSVQVARIFAHHMGALPDMARRVKAWIDRFTPWLDLASQERLIAEVAQCPLKWSADKLAWKLRLTDEQRTELRIRTIGAIDCNAQQRAERRRKAKIERERNRRAAKRVPSI